MVVLKPFAATKASSAQEPYVLSSSDFAQVDKGNGVSFRISLTCGPSKLMKARKFVQVDGERKTTDEDLQENFSQIICAAKGTWLEVLHLRSAGMAVVDSGGASLRKIMSSEHCN